MNDQEQKVFDLIEARTRRGVPLAEVAADMRSLGVDPDAIEKAVQYKKEIGRRYQLLEIPGGMESLEYRQTVREAKSLAWYAGPQKGDSIWPLYRHTLKESGLPEAAVRDIDSASSKIVAYLAPPDAFGLQKKGLVLGHVQSGKTANFTAVIAKAADAGYRLFIILSGIHNALRRQTQRRLEEQLVVPASGEWVQLTDMEADFGRVLRSDALIRSRDVHILAVVKKNPRRLEAMHRWLEEMPDEIRRRCPTLIIDDESDQATPNTAKDGWDRTTINRLIVDVRKALPTSTYVAYTATPFANVFIDPQDEEDLYPSDFIISLPRPGGYFGAESLFGREAPEGDGGGDYQPSDGLDMIRLVPEEDADSLRPPRAKVDRISFEPPVPPSLEEAIRWFVLATAVRRVRGQTDDHSSMLVHTTQYSHVHLQHRDQIRKFVDDLRDSVGTMEERREFESLWKRESGRVSALELGEKAVAWDEVYAELPTVLAETDVLAENYIAEDRLTYEGYDSGRTVIAVGGNTLSRGLTLEGLVVSFFIRSASAYDTLLQMGRWFGYRRGYADLPRIWMTGELADAFRHLATVEAEIRSEIERYEDERLTPRQCAVRVRTHPSLLITSRLKQQNVQPVQVSYAGRRLQTFVFSHRDEVALRRNLKAGRDLIQGAISDGVDPQRKDDGKYILRGVEMTRVKTFIEAYDFHEIHRDLRPSLLVAYIERRFRRSGELARWNVGVLGGRPTGHRIGERMVQLGTIDLGLPEPVPLINRAPLKTTGRVDLADIKALMSKPDRVFDLDIPPRDARSMSEGQLSSKRPKDVGLLLLYPISKDSEPMGAARRADSRRHLNAPEHVLGVALVFPESSSEWADPEEIEYVAVPVEPEVYVEVEDVDREELDTEGDFIASGEEGAVVDDRSAG